MCYGTRTCKYCDGTGIKATSIKKVFDILLSLWWISWIGIIGAFLMVVGMEFQYVWRQARRVSPFSLVLLTTTSMLWIVFFAIESKARNRVDGRKNQLVVVHLLTMSGSFLAILTLLAIFFFIYIDPRIQ